MEIVSYLIKSFEIEKVIQEIEETFCSLDIIIRAEGHDFYLIKFNTFNNRKDRVVDVNFSHFEEFFQEISHTILSYEKV